MGGSYPGYAADDCVLRESGAERFFVAHAILDNDKRGLVVYSRFEKWRYLGWVYCFMGADNVVKRRCDFVW